MKRIIFAMATLAGAGLICVVDKQMGKMHHF